MAFNVLGTVKSFSPFLYLSPNYVVSPFSPSSLSIRRDASCTVHSIFRVWTMDRTSRTESVSAIETDNYARRRSTVIDNDDEGAMNAIPGWV